MTADDGVARRRHARGRVGHGHADVRRRERPGVVQAVADHQDMTSPRLRLRDERELVVWRLPEVHPAAEEPLPARALAVVVTGEEAQLVRGRRAWRRRVRCLRARPGTAGSTPTRLRRRRT